jgi:hypothetical protein
MSTDQRKPTTLPTEPSRQPMPPSGASPRDLDLANLRKRLPLAFVAALLVLALMNLAACGTGAGSTAASHPTMMQLPPYAANMRVAITSPANGTVVTGNSVTVAVAATGYTVTCDLAGKTNKQGSGHYHILLDKALVNMFCTPTATISMQNVSSGRHTLTAVPALNDHTEVEANGSSITIDYEPAHPLPAITGATFAGAPSIKILSPANGATVSSSFDIVVQVTNYNLSCDLMGKPDVPGYGHWHANLDTMSGPMMGMGTMLGMSCSTTFHASTTGLKAGETHTIIALLTDNGHAPLNPAVDSQVTVMIGG